MANVINACPDERVFRKLGGNELAEADREAVLRHLEVCEACAHRASALSCDDVLVDLVREAGARPAVANAGALVDEILQLWPGTSGVQETVNLRGTGDAHGRPPPGRADANPVATTPDDASAAFPLTPAGAQPYDFLAPPEQQDELGRLGAYRVLEVLGSGGMGVVFRAEDALLRRQAALKVMLPGIATDPSGKERFLREARAAASIKHDHVVTIYQVDQEKGIPFIAMELLKGESLEKRLARDRKVSVLEALRIGREIAEGLAAAHDLGLVHRDIKPANIWLETRKAKGPASGESAGEGSVSIKVRVKILDFGLACGTGEEGRITRKGVIVGTAAYMSPEQARGNAPDARGDLFSLGCVLYAMCAGEPPYSGTDFISTLVSVVSSAPKHLRKLDPTLPAEFADLVMQMLEKKPADRPQSAHEVARKLTALEKSLRSARKDRPRRSGWSSSPRSGPARQPASFWRRPRVFMGIVGALALVAGCGAWLAMMTFEPRKKFEPRKIEAKDFEPKKKEEPNEPNDLFKMFNDPPPPPPPPDKFYPPKDKGKKGLKGKGGYDVPEGPPPPGPFPDKGGKEKGPPMKGFQANGPRAEFLRGRRD